jgi:hypothetical protein
MDDPGLVDPVLDLAGLLLAHRRRDVHRDRAELRVRHDAARTEDAAQATNHSHHVGGRDHAVEVEPVLVLDLLGEVVAADEVRPGLAGLVLLLALGEHEHAGRLAETVGQHERATHHLLGLAGIDAQVHRHVDRLVELRRLELEEQPHRLGERVGPRAIDLRLGAPEALARSHRASPPLPGPSSEPSPR